MILPIIAFYFSFFTVVLYIYKCVCVYGGCIIIGRADDAYYLQAPDNTSVSESECLMTYEFRFSIWVL